MGGGGSLNTEEALLKGNEVRVGHIAGTIGQDEQMRFKKLIFRATRGNALTYFQDLKNPIEDYYGKKHEKTVYVVVF